VQARGFLRPRSSWHRGSLLLTLASGLALACGPAPEEEASLMAQSASALSDTPRPTAVTELVTNGTFGNGAVAPWWNNASTQVRVENGRLRVDVAANTANLWDAIIGQSGIPLASGKTYTLSFKASASSNFSVRATVQQESAPYTSVLTQQFSVTPTSQQFQFTFPSSLSTGQGQVTFQLGGRSAAATFFLDDISLTTDGATQPPGGSGPIAMTSGFYVDPNSGAAGWVRANGGDSRASSIQASIASKPGARWFGNWSGDIGTAVSGYVAAADAADKLPVLVAYNIPGRDCGSHSAGGAGSPDAYRAWISAFATAIGNRPAVVIIEPDAVAQLDCLKTDSERQVRLGLLRYASEQLRDKAVNTWAYLDGGNARWIGADVMAQRLDSAGVKNIRGFALNVSNFYTTDESNTYGTSVSGALSSRYGYTKKFTVDTSRNGNGSNGEWCNPGGRKLGATSQVSTGSGAELLLWVKSVGESDGNCGIAPGAAAGQFSPDLAIRLINGT
jgi:endoglucanase